MQITDFQIPALRSLAGPKVVACIALLSAGLFGFLVWLLFIRQSSGESSAIVDALPAIDATMNLLSAIFLISAWRAVRRRNYVRHIQFIFAALACSAVFLIGYVTYHGFHGDTHFQGIGVARPIYFLILITHILLSAVMLPLILTSLYLALSGRFRIHKRVSRWTLPVWLYVSVTGVVIFLMLKIFNA
jgi:putative membrane protein